MEVLERKYTYNVFADVNNGGRKCIFSTNDWSKARRLMEQIKNGKFAGCYLNPELKRKGA